MDSRPANHRSHRRKRRTVQHQQADLAEATLPEVEAIEHPLVPTGEPLAIETPEAVADLVATLRRERDVAFDTEFIGEETFRPRICLVQIATPTLVALVDPLALSGEEGREAMASLFRELADASHRLLVHAGFHDAEAVRLGAGREIACPIDTQVAAAMVGLPWPASLAAFLEHFTGHRPGKAHTFTDWDARPLSPRQRRYAADDVRYLPLAWSRLEAELDRRGRLPWAIAESAAAMRDSPFDPASQVKRIIRGDLVGAAARSIVKALVLVRHELAREMNLPPRGVLPDLAVAEIALARPSNAASLRRLRGVSSSLADAAAERLVAAAAAAAAAPPRSDPLGEALAHRRVRDAVGEAWPRLQQHCREQDLAAELVIVRRDFTRWYGREVALHRGIARAAAIGESQESPFEPGSWREDAAGEFARAMRRQLTESP
jgi:ribonuclease D